MFESLVFAPTSFNIAVATAGGFLVAFGLVSHGVKQRLLLSEALVAVVAGVFLSRVVSLVRPYDYTCGGAEDVKLITLEFSRLVLGIQLLLAGVQLPCRYMYTARSSLFYLLGPGLTLSWMSAGLVIWVLLPNLGLMGALMIAACIAPTDPILSNAIIKGRFAERNTPQAVRELISAEAGMNDGLGYPFLFICLLYFKFVEGEANVGGMLSAWLVETCGYVVVLSIIYGAVSGYVAQKLHSWSAKQGHIEHESSLVFDIALSLFVLGTCGILQTDDVLACFIAGCAYGWNHRFRPSRANELFCSTIDMLLNAFIFIWYGAVAPWGIFLSNDIISLPKLILLGVLILLLRRLPIVLALKSKVPELETRSQAAFVGFFGPIGVSAIFYLMIGREFLLKLAESSSSEPFKTKMLYLEQCAWIVVWFLVMDSVLVHGIALPVAKLFRKTFPNIYRRYLKMNHGSSKEALGQNSEQARLIADGQVYGTMPPDDVV